MESVGKGDRSRERLTTFHHVYYEVLDPGLLYNLVVVSIHGAEPIMFEMMPGRKKHNRGKRMQLCKKWGTVP